MSDGTITAYLFQCQASDLFAVSLDKPGATLPLVGDNQRWLLREEFQLGLLQPMPVPVDADRVLRGIEDAGYFIFDATEKHK